MQHLLVELNKRSIKLQLSGDQLRIDAPKGALDDALREQLRQHKAQLIALLHSEERVREKTVSILPNQERRHEPFSLTDVQHAYWMGRSDFVEGGGVATHLYMELERKGLDVERLDVGF